MGFLECIAGKMRRRGLSCLLGVVLSIGAGLWAPSALGAGLPAGHALYLWGYNDSGAPSILMDVYGIKPNMMVEDLRYGGTFSYNSSSINGNTTRMVIIKNGTGRIPDDAHIMDLIFTSAKSGLLRNNYSAEYENGILVDTAGMREGIFQLVAIPPGTPSAYGPSGSSDNTPYFSWSAVDDATWYQVWVERNGQKYIDTWTQSTHWSPGDWPSGSYEWWVRAYNGVHGSWSSGKTFSIASFAPSTSPTMIAPMGTQPMGTSRPRFSWQAVDNAGWYRVWVSREGQQGSYAEKWVQAPATSWIPNVDFSGGSYIWWVVGWSADGYGPWSGGESFSVPTMRPGVVTLDRVAPWLYPTYNRLLYIWQADERATWYQLWSGRDGRVFHNQWYSADDVVSGEDAVAYVSTHQWGRYRWYVRGWGPDGFGGWSTVGEFVLGQPSVLSGAADLFTWDDLCSGAEWYQIWINDVSGGGRVKERVWWFPIEDTTPEQGFLRSLPVAPALTTGDYEWAIRAWSSTFGQGPWSDVQRFSVP